MKLIKAIIRPEMVDSVVDALEAAGHPAFTKLEIVGRGKQGGLKVGEIVYNELSKTMILLAIEEDELDEMIEIIKSKAHTGQFGDGKIFVQPIEESYTIRTGEKHV
ncbi:MAG: P-II family nitrogen regulator [Methanosarcinales archaeon]|jgi:nitrogen regulatory protein PII 1|nr:P-II family nitrogen regulator [Methanosarcinales archaeon]